jgi:heat shock protein HslJ
MQVLLVLLALVTCVVGGGCRAAEEGVPLEGTWILVELEGVDVAALARAPELVIGPEGALSGFSGVNRFSGRAVPESLRAGELLTGPLAATRMAGDAQAMEVEQRFFELLAKRLELRRNDGELTLSEGGAVRARFRAK